MMCIMRGRCGCCGGYRRSESLPLQVKPEQPDGGAMSFIVQVYSDYV
jgi:hypothetical protein